MFSLEIETLNTHNIYGNQPAMNPDLNRWIQTALNSTVNEISALERVSRHLADPSVLVPLLSGILKRNEILAEVSERSYQHDNGFDKIVLFASTQPEFVVRLHVWNDRLNMSEGNIHNHRWNFSSTVLMGSLHVEEFVEGRDVTMVDNIYRHPKGSEEYVLHPVGSVRLRLARAMTFGTGDNYNCEYRVLHRAVAKREAITLVVTGARRQTETRVITPAETPFSSATPFRYLATQKVENQVARLVEFLCGK